MKTVIMAAGFGSRLWPLSTSEKPKQFQPLINGASLLKYTYAQLQNITPTEDLYVLMLEGMQELVTQELPKLSADKMIIVPERRNTLPHTLWALSKIGSDEEEPILFKSVDLFTHDEDAFLTSLSQVINAQRELSQITLLCTKYDTFNSNDGYCVADKNGNILQFLEKPTQEALESVAGAHDLYRSPMIYIASKSTMKDALSELPSEWLSDAEALLSGSQETLEHSFLRLPFIDISSALFQKSHKLRIAEINYRFTDVGRFEEIHSLNVKDANGNVIIGEVIVDGDCRNNLIINKTDVPLVVISKNKTVIVQTPEGSLVSSFAEAHKIGEIYKQQIHQAQLQ